VVETDSAIDVDSAVLGGSHPALDIYSLIYSFVHAGRQGLLLDYLHGLSGMHKFTVRLARHLRNGSGCHSIWLHALPATALRKWAPKGDAAQLAP
jgi:hypothetical protein